MASERRPPEDLQEAVAATLRRLRGEGGGSPQPGNRTEPQLSTPFGPRPVTPAAPTNSSTNAPTVVVASPAATPAMAAKTPPEPEPDLLSAAGIAPEVPLSPAGHASALKQFRVAQSAGEVADKPRRGLLPYAAALAGLIVAAGVAWGAYRVVVGGAAKNGVVPTLVADQTPEKVPPTAADQNANEATDQDKTIYNEISPNSANATASPKGEVLLPAPETPQKPPAPPQPAPSASEAASGGVNIDQPASVAATAPAGEASATVPSTAPSGAPTNGATANSAAAVPAEGNAAVPPLAPAAPASGAMAGSAASASTAAPAPAQTSAAATPAAPVATATAPTATQTAALTAGSFRIQLAAVKSEAAAKKTWKRLLAKHQDLLGPLTMEIVRADLGSQGVYYRVQAGPFAEKAAARDACAKLKAQGQQCLVKP
jgi:SPOR domain